MRCPKCNSENKGTGTFCNNCGANIYNISQNIHPVPQQPQNAYKQTFYQNNQQATKKRGGAIASIGITLAVVAVLIIVIGAIATIPITVKENIISEDINVRFETSTTTSTTIILTPAHDITELKFDIVFKDKSKKLIYKEEQTIYSANKGQEYKFTYNLITMYANYPSIETYGVENIEGKKEIKKVCWA